jgi:hypothetical protein
MISPGGAPCPLLRPVEQMLPVKIVLVTAAAPETTVSEAAEFSPECML